jgi:hypothetical protein
MKAREIHLYSEKIKEDDLRNLFNTILRSRLPLFGLIDFSDFFSFNFVKLIANRKNNTIKLYVKEKKDLKNLSALVFPFRLSEVMEFEEAKGGFGIPPKFFILRGRNDFMDFMMKENIIEIHMVMSRVLGTNYGIGSATDEHGRKSLLFIPTPTKFFLIDLEKNPSIYIELLEPIPKKMSTTSKFPVFEDPGLTLGVDNYDPFQHTMVVGASGTGKSKALYVLLRALEDYKKDDVRMLIVDPHGEFLRMYPHAKAVNFVDNYVEPLDMGGQRTPLMTQLIAQLITTTIGQENKYSERVLFYAVHLLTSIDKLDLENISLLLTDSSTRAEFISTSDNDEVKRFFDEEFNDIYIHHFNDAILPILNFVGEYKLYLGKEMKQEGLVDLLKKNRVVVVSFDPHFFGKRMISFLAGAIINQMYILAITGQLQDKPTVLAVDEFSRVETKIARDILIETRKFNLYFYMSIQYLNQLSKEVYDSVIGNVRNIVAFKLSRQDATSVSSIMEIKIEEFFKKNRTQTELEESKKEMFVRLNQRECIVRLFDGKTYMIPMKVRVVDAAKWGWNKSMEVKETGEVEQNEADPDNPGAQGSGSRPPWVAPEEKKAAQAEKQENATGGNEKAQGTGDETDYAASEDSRETGDEKTAFHGYGGFGEGPEPLMKSGGKSKEEKEDEAGKEEEGKDDSEMEEEGSDAESKDEEGGIGRRRRAKRKSEEDEEGAGEQEEKAALGQEEEAPAEIDTSKSEAEREREALFKALKEGKAQRTAGRDETPKPAAKKKMKLRRGGEEAAPAKKGKGKKKSDE